MRKPDLACYSDTMLIDAALDQLTAQGSAPELIAEIVARGLADETELRARVRLTEQTPTRRSPGRAK